MKNQILALFSALFLVVAATSSQASESVTLSEYLSQALSGNDALQTARTDFLVSTEKSRQSGVLPDPKLALQYYLEPVETRTGPQNASIAISQALPWFNKLSLTQELSDHNTAIAAAGLAAVELDVTRQVKEAYVEYGFLSRSQQTIRDNIELLRYLEGVARTRYAGGKTTFFDVLKIQIELSQSEDKSLALIDQEQPMRVHINSLLGTEPERTRTLPGNLPQVLLSKDEAEIHLLTLSKAPLLQSAQESIAKARTARKLAEKDFYPDFNVSLKTIFTGSAEFGNPADSGKDPVIAGLSFNLPIFWDSRYGAVAEKKAKIRSAQSFQRLQIRLLRTKVERSLYAYREAHRKFLLYREDLLPKVKQQLEVAVNGFQSGETSILELIDAQKSLLVFELAESRALADRALAVARLESQAGTTLANWNKN